MNDINKILQARADYEAMLIAEEKLKPLIMKNKLHRTPADYIRISNIVFLKNGHYEIKGK